MPPVCHQRLGIAICLACVLGPVRSEPACLTCGSEVGQDEAALLQLGRQGEAEGRLTREACPARSKVIERDVLENTRAPNGSLQDDRYPGHAIEFFNADCKPSTLNFVANRGGLVQDFFLDGVSVVFNRPVPDQLDGTSFWPSPQSTWGWPPPLAIDPTPSGDYTLAYKVQVNESLPGVSLSSEVSDKLDIWVGKTYWVNATSKAVVADYEIHNDANQTQSYAPWEITRVRPEGLTFFMSGASAPTSGTWDPLDLEFAANATWYQQNTSLGEGKMYADTGEGWLAHTDGSIVLVKCFEKIPEDAAAPGEQQVEIYNGVDYVEVEEQGAYTAIEAGSVLKWQVRWQQRMLPDYLQPPKIGDERLLAFVRGMCDIGEGSGGSGAGPCKKTAWQRRPWHRRP